MLSSAKHNWQPFSSGNHHVAVQFVPRFRADMSAARGWLSALSAHVGGKVNNIFGNPHYS